MTIQIPITIPKLIIMQLIEGGYSEEEINLLYSEYCISLLEFPNSILEIAPFSNWLSVKLSL
jgi:hypothetical protein